MAVKVYKDIFELGRAAAGLFVEIAKKARPFLVRPSRRQDAC